LVGGFAVGGGELRIAARVGTFGAVAEFGDERCGVPSVNARREQQQPGLVQKNGRVAFVFVGHVAAFRSVPCPVQLERYPRRVIVAGVRERSRETDEIVRCRIGAEAYGHETTICCYCTVGSNVL
jgi:hypothetical protein